MKRETFPANAETMNALVNALGATVMALSEVLTPEQKEGFARNLSRLAMNAEKMGDTTLETMLIDLQQAAR